MTLVEAVKFWWTIILVVFGKTLAYADFDIFAAKRIAN